MLAWLQRVRPDSAVDESPAVLEDARLGLVPPARRVRPQPLRVRRRARKYLGEFGVLLSSFPLVLSYLLTKDGQTRHFCLMKPTLLSMEKESVCSAHMATSPPSTSSFMAGVTVNPLSSSNLYRSFSYCFCQPEQISHFK